MNEEHLKVVDINGVKAEIPWSAIRSLQGRIEAVQIKDGASVFIGGTYEIVELTTSRGVFKIPRSSDNDAEILTFMLDRQLPIS